MGTTYKYRAIQFRPSVTDRDMQVSSTRSRYERLRKLISLVDKSQRMIDEARVMTTMLAEEDRAIEDISEHTQKTEDSLFHGHRSRETRDRKDCESKEPQEYGEAETTRKSAPNTKGK